VKTYTAAEVAEGRLRSSDGRFAPEYDARYGHRHRAPRAPFNFTRRRITEIEKLIEHRHGVVQPTDDADRYIWMVAQHLRELYPATLQDEMRRWCARWAPEVPMDEVDMIAIRAAAEPYRFKADTIAVNLAVTDTERTSLGLTTIGAKDRLQPQRELDRAQRKRERDKSSAERRRRREGALPRAEYEAKSLTQTKPWLAEGISRRTWERQKYKRALELLPENWRDAAWQKAA
jgi:hypothetical protein